MKALVQTLCLTAILLYSPTESSARDWRQYRGPGHDGVSTDRIQKQWPATGPTELWRIPCTNGLSSFCVGDGRAFTQIRRTLTGKAREVCIALDARTGAELWAVDVGPASYDGGAGNDDGPRSTPTLEGGRLYVYTSQQVVHCLNATNGASVWRKDLRALYSASAIAWQGAASPLIVDGLLFLNANTARDSLFALRIEDGSLAWRSQAEEMTHATPVAATIDGVPQIIHATQTGLVSVKPADGTLLWKANYPFSYSTSLAASPLVCSNIVFITANYSMGSFAVRVSQSEGVWKASPIWNNGNYKAHWMSPVYHEGYIYGLFGSSTTASLKCIDVLTGTQKWSVSGFGRGGTLLVDNTLMILAEKGDLVLAKPTPLAYTELARATLFPDYDADANKCWNIPAVADGRVYARGTASAVCLDLAIANLKLLPPTITADQVHLYVGLSNGEPVDESRLAAISVRYSTDLATPIQDWQTLDCALLLTNGVVRIDDTIAAFERKFYVVAEQP